MRQLRTHLVIEACLSLDKVHQDVSRAAYDVSASTLLEG
jgi:hypothetical protein